MKIAVVFDSKNIVGDIYVHNGKLEKLSASGGIVNGSGFNFKDVSNARLTISLKSISIEVGAHQTVVTVNTSLNPFSFNLRDIHSTTPVFIPEFRVAVIPANDSRNYDDVAADIADKKLISDFDRLELEPEESYENAGRFNREQYCPTWLGVGRDMRLFRTGYQEYFGYWGYIQPCYHSFAQSLPESKDLSYQIFFEIGAGANCRPKIKRRLDQGVLPILLGVQEEGELSYHITMFASLETKPVSNKNIIGSDWKAAYANTNFNMLSQEDRAGLSDLLRKEMRERDEETVCCLRVEAVNSGQTPNFAFFKAGHYIPFRTNTSEIPANSFKNGFSTLDDINKIYAVNRINGCPMKDSEMAVLIQPGEKTVFDLLVPHSPISPERAEKLLKFDFEKHLSACQKFWNDKLATAAAIELPEKVINESIQAGLLHCDLTTLGQEPDGPALATIGWYAPIGTESSPIIQFFDSMGWHKLAERSIQFFLERQLENGFIQNFNNYESETGALLWTMGEHFRYTSDTQWLEKISKNIIRACDYLLNWRNKNKKPEFLEKGFYGLLDGKTADPDDFYHSFFLNAGTYVGLSRAAEMLKFTESGYAVMLSEELKAYKKDIINAVYFCQKHAPVIPLGDGSWAPALPPWVEYHGRLSLYADGENCFTHGSFLSRDTLIGAMWLIISEVLEPNEQASDFLIKTNQYPATVKNAGLSQPYYCRHDFAHLKRGEVKKFLKTFYNQLSALHDRETYSFWEHYYRLGEHKTHEEAWFLMQVRWMLYLEENTVLSLLKGIPRRWLENGKKIVLDKVKSYFGTISLNVISSVNDNFICANFVCHSNNPPSEVRLRLPHPDGHKAVHCEGGTYDSLSETISVITNTKRIKIKISF